ncbi:MAG: virginiamycin A acetyltransferase [Paracoccaceae bacterium]|jgi:virginiamycin A acetyltransferase
MARPFLDAAARHPLTMPGGGVHPGLVHLARVIEHPNIDAGDHSYASDFGDVTDWASHLAPYLYPGAPERLIIGRFVQVAHGARFITASANHPRRGISTYPFAIFNPDTTGAYAAEVAETGDTAIGADAWIGHGALILPGVTVGPGAIIDAGAVVACDVPPFAVVAGNPAQVVRMRFSAAEVADLLGVRWWDRPLDWIAAHQRVIEAGDVSALVRAARGGDQ